MQVEVCLTGKCGQCYRCWCMELVRKNHALDRLLSAHNVWPDPMAIDDVIEACRRLTSSARDLNEKLRELAAALMAFALKEREPDKR